MSGPLNVSTYRTEDLSVLGIPKSAAAPCLPSASCLFLSPVLRLLTSQTVITQAVLLPRADLHQLKHHTSPNFGYSPDTLDVLLVLA